MIEELVELICNRISAELPRLQAEFTASGSEVGVRYAVLDDLLPQELAQRIHAVFPSPDQMRLMKSFRETKYTSKDFDAFDPLVKDITFAIQSPRIVALVEQFTGIREQVPDAALYAGGLSMMGPGHFLNPHIDNSHDGERQLYRTLNLLYYVTPDWSLESGGNLELWDQSVKKGVTIVSRFNRLVLMETNPTSWHSVSPVAVDGLRCCVSNYYFSPLSPTGVDYFNVTSFSARPEQSVRRLLATADNLVRGAVRAVAPGGLGRKDVYDGKPPR
jgi:Rps23 Pro-64 3,4-dihydroxylase Tpa1-like proline 4-hydroxylase